MSSKKYKVAIIGMDHCHANLLFDYFQKNVNDKVEWIGYADIDENCPEEELERKFQLNFSPVMRNNPDEYKRYKSYIELLDQKPDIAIICTDIASHARICEETLSRNIHTIVEKPMATTFEDGMRMYRAAKRSSAELVINWPIAWFPAFNKAKELADSGIIGDVLRFNYRSPSTRGPYRLDEHTPEQLSKMWWYDSRKGGGSIMDYAGYGCVLSTWFMNEQLPLKVSGVKKNFFLPFADTEDYSTFTIEYENAVSIIEGSWATISNGEIATGPVIYGTEGVIVADRFDPQVKVYKELAPYVPSPAPTEVYDTEPMSVNIADSFINYLEKGTPLHRMVTVDFNIRAMAVLDAGIRACDSGNSEAVKRSI
ncbi:MAG: Gfo/Idh/MocA family protein [Monoglobaceae bacterium]